MPQHEQKVIGNGYALEVDALLVWQNNIWFMLSLCTYNCECLRLCAVLNAASCYGAT